MQTIVLASQKGGSGKSTFAIGLALAAKQAGHKVRLIENDQQGTLSNWQSRRGLAEPTLLCGATDVEQRLALLDRGGHRHSRRRERGGAACRARREEAVCLRAQSDANPRPAHRRGRRALGSEALRKMEDVGR